MWKLSLLVLFSLVIPNESREKIAIKYRQILYEVPAKRVKGMAAAYKLCSANFGTLANINDPLDIVAIRKKIHVRGSYWVASKAERPINGEPFIPGAMPCYTYKSKKLNKKSSCKKPHFALCRRAIRGFQELMHWEEWVYFVPNEQILCDQKQETLCKKYEGKKLDFNSPNDLSILYNREFAVNHSILTGLYTDDRKLSNLTLFNFNRAIDESEVNGGATCILREPIGSVDRFKAVGKYPRRHMLCKWKVSDLFSIMTGRLKDSSS